MRRPATAGSVMPRKSSGTRSASPAARTAASAAIVCISVSPVPPDFDTATKRVAASGRRREQRGVGPGVEVVHEMQARAGAQRADAGDAAAGELRHRLAAEARSAGAEKDDVLGAGDEPLCGRFDAGEVVGLLREAAAAAACRRRGGRG